ncbi:MAG: hypothetical protein M0R06_09890, partial [Sphaerochaeta sp.]|nr:hypothetical protein [Sphaerochaeta sp.]
MPQSQYAKGTLLTDQTGKQLTVNDPNQFFSEDYKLVNPTPTGTTDINQQKTPTDVPPAFTPPPLTAASSADTFLKSSSANLEASKAQVEAFRNSQLKKIAEDKKAEQEKETAYAAQEKAALDTSKTITEPFRADLEKTERERFKIEDNYFANQKSVGELETLMNEATTTVQSMKEKTGLDIIRTPKINEAVSNYNARIGVVKAVMAARNNQINVAENLIDRTVAAVNADRQDQLKYYDAVRSYYSGLKDDSGKKIVALAADEDKIIEERVSQIKSDIAESEKVANKIKEMMFTDPQRVEGSGISVNDSMETISKKLSDYDYKKGVTDVRNKMAEGGYFPVSTPEEAKRLAAAGRQVVEIEDIKGNKSYYVAPPPKATGGTKATEDDKRLAQYQKDLDAAIERLSATLAGTAEDDKMTTWGKEW